MSDNKDHSPVSDHRHTSDRYVVGPGAKEIGLSGVCQDNGLNASGITVTVWSTPLVQRCRPVPCYSDAYPQRKVRGGEDVVHPGTCVQWRTDDSPRDRFPVIAV